jgi:hypothetical protein
MIETLRLYLLETITETIYIGFTPAEPDTCITINQTAGFPPDPKHQYNSIGLQVRTRSGDYVTASELAYRVFSKFQSLSKSNSTIENLVQITAQQNPYPLGKDEQSRFLFTQNFVVYFSQELEHRS